jgi:hypothetical protein
MCTDSHQTTGQAIDTDEIIPVQRAMSIVAAHTKAKLRRQ